MIREMDWMSVSKPERALKDTELTPLFVRLSQGDLDPLGEIYALMSKEIYGLALWQTRSSSDASDVVQEVFVRLASRARHLESVRHPRSYLLQMAHHSAVDLLRKGGREVPLDDPLIVPSPGRMGTPDQALVLSTFLRRLPVKQREAIYLHYMVGLSLRETAGVTGVSLFTAASRCRIGIGKLQSWYGEKR